MWIYLQNESWYSPNIRTSGLIADFPEDWDNSRFDTIPFIKFSRNIQISINIEPFVNNNDDRTNESKLPDSHNAWNESKCEN